MCCDLTKWWISSHWEGWWIEIPFLLSPPKRHPSVHPQSSPCTAFFLLLTTLQFSFLMHVPVPEFARHWLEEDEPVGPGITNEALDLGHTLIFRSCSQGPAKWALTLFMLILIYRSFLCYKILVRKPEGSPPLRRSARVLLLLLLFILTANGISPGGSGTTKRHNTQTRHNTHHTK
jgi:hypothetical protein